jgi:arabinogalactan endo-1,4-beta-galactosidase
VNGLSWWYAEANAYGCTGDLKNGWYNAGLFNNNNGRALDALYEMKSFVGDDASVSPIDIDSPEASTWHSLDGRQFTATPSTPGIYLRSTPSSTHKVLVR